MLGEAEDAAVTHAHGGVAPAHQQRRLTHQAACKIEAGEEVNAFVTPCLRAGKQPTVHSKAVNEPVQLRERLASFAWGRFSSCGGAKRDEGACETEMSEKIAS
jgi:hypothetical protein